MAGRRKPVERMSRAEKVISFIEHFLVIPEGAHVGRSVRLRPWQREIIVAIYDGEDSDKRIRRAIISVARKNGKALALDTPIPTPDGWTTMGAIEVGDRVFGADGLPCCVTDVSPVYIGNPCYRVVFSNGEMVIADADHQWLTTARVNAVGQKTGRRCRRTIQPKFRRYGTQWVAQLFHRQQYIGSRISMPEHEARRRFEVMTRDDLEHVPLDRDMLTRVRTTKEIADTLTYGSRNDRNHSLAMPAPLQLPEADLSVDPYLLGYWLGDGHSASAKLTVGDADLQNLLSELAKVGVLAETKQDRRTGAWDVQLRAAAMADLFDVVNAEPKRSSRNLQIVMRQLGVLGNKHIPSIYLRSSEAQRAALLQGLMDSDGTVVSRGSGAQFTTIKPVLADCFAELLASLGIKFSCVAKPMRCNGKPVPGVAYQFQFMPDRSRVEVFRLPRKLARVAPIPKTASRSRTVQIVSCEPVPSVPVKCIAVDSPDSLYLFGRTMLPTHNTALIAMLVLAHVVGPEAKANSQVYSAAQSRDQASLVFSLAAKMVRMSRDLNELVTVRDSAKELFCIRTGVRYKALSADATTAYGLSPALVIHDELGQVRGPRSELYDALETAMGAQAEPLSIIISTQAPTDADLLSILIDDAAAAHDPSTILFLWAASLNDDPYNEATWHKANPALADFRSLEDMRESAERARRMPAFEASFRNLFLNQRVAATNHFLTPDVWKANGGPPDRSAFDDYAVYGGLDLSSRQDLTALVLVARDPAGIVHVDAQFFAPEQGLRDRAQRDRAPYDVWRDQSFLTATPGRTVDYAWVATHIAEISSRCDLKRIRFDRWRIEDLRRELERIGCTVELEEHGQGFRDMSPAIDELEALALNAQLRHGNNPILTWCAANAVVTRDAANNRKLDKSKATGRIDGLVALAMAISAAGEAFEAEPDYQVLVLGMGA